MTMTCQELRDYLDWQCQIGNGNWSVQIDRRGDFCVEPPCPMTLVSIPAPGEFSDRENKIVFIRAVPL